MSKIASKFLKLTAKKMSKFPKYYRFVIVNCLNAAK